MAIETGFDPRTVQFVVSRYTRPTCSVCTRTINQQMHYSYSLLFHSTAPTCFDARTSSSRSFLRCLLSYIKTHVDLWYMPRSLHPVVVEPFGIHSRLWGGLSHRCLAFNSSFLSVDGITCHISIEAEKKRSIEWCITHRLYRFLGYKSICTA
jgi:hypothetical protein